MRPQMASGYWPSGRRAGAAGSPFFAHGCRAALSLVGRADAPERVKEVLVEETAFRLYRSFPDPKSSQRYTFMVAGAAVPFANGAPVPLHAFRSQDDFFNANRKLNDPGPMSAPDPPPVRAAIVPPAQGLDELLQST